MQLGQFYDIDEIDPSRYPALIGYWKCDEGSGNVLHDSSINGHDLNYQFLPAACPIQNFNADGGEWSRFPGSFSPATHMGAYVAADGTNLITGTNAVIIGAQISIDSSVSGQAGNFDTVDFDIGTYHYGSPGSPYPETCVATAAGYNLLAVAFANTIENNKFGFRIASTGGAAQSVAPENIMNDSFNFYGDKKTISVCGGVVLQNRMCLSQDYIRNNIRVPSRDTFLLDATHTSLDAQAVSGTKYFGLHNQVGFNPIWGIKNLYLWSFSSFNPGNDIAIIVDKLKLADGKIPAMFSGLS